MSEANEILDLFDAKEQRIGTIGRSGIKALQPDGGRYIRAVNAFIQRPDGKLWVPVRSLHKSIAPGGLDYSTGGHVEQGESYEECLVRELAEEAGFTDVDPSALHLVQELQPDADNSIYFCRTYLLRTEKTPQLSDEHTSGEWLTIDELIRGLQHGTPAKRSLLPDAYALEKYLAG